ncbi:MAG: phosphatase PAP2 family protein [Clostridia bacterium]|nr:phosphatase PAP2 family protein [Clostridia bacterium]
MDVLYFFEGIRTDFGNAFFSAITTLGEETAFIVIGLIFLWCINKKQGYYLLSVGILGTIINQFLKIVFCIPRPWVLDKNFTVVEGAKKMATGYSFPSGHTQVGVGLFAGIGMFLKNKWAKIGCVILCVLVPVSRMYLGVHTPLDVGVSIIVALALSLLLYPVAHSKNENWLSILFGAVVLLQLASLLFMNFFPFSQAVDPAEIAHSRENASKMFGCAVGLLTCYELDRRKLKYCISAPVWAQILKVALGLIPILAIKALLKEPLYVLFVNENVADFVRYLLIALFAGGVWPCTFKLFAKMGKSSKTTK